MFLTRLVLALFLLIAAGSEAWAQNGSTVARAYREAHEPRILRDFAELLKRPNRAFTPEENRETAVYIRDLMRGVGVDTRLVKLEGASPAILGVLKVPGASRAAAPPPRSSEED